MHVMSVSVQSTNRLFLLYQYEAHRKVAFPNSAASVKGLLAGLHYAYH
jgi:hypothetical protein